MQLKVKSLDLDLLPNRCGVSYVLCLFESKIVSKLFLNRPRGALFVYLYFLRQEISSICLTFSLF